MVTTKISRSQQPLSGPPDHPSGEMNIVMPWASEGRHGEGVQRGSHATSEIFLTKRPPAARPARPAHVEKRCHGGLGKPDKKRGLPLPRGPPLSPAPLRSVSVAPKPNERAAPRTRERRGSVADGTALEPSSSSSASSLLVHRAQLSRFVLVL